MSSKFERDLIAFSKRVKADHSKAIAKVGLEFARRVILKTPVDTGRARANWQATIGAPAGGPLTAVDPSGRTAIAKAVQAWGRPPENPVLWLTNNLDYVAGLERGRSRQAPAGMVAVSLAEMQSLFR